MANTNEVIWGESMGTKIKMVTTSADSGGELLRMETKQSKEGYGPPDHYHSGQVEDYEIISGELTLTMDRKEVVVGPGDTFHVPIGAHHTFKATSDEPCHYFVDHRPALTFKDFMVTICDLAYDGRSNAKGMPSMLHLMAILNRTPGEQYIVGPPKAAQRLLQLVGGAVGKLRGYETTYRSSARESAGLTL
jgi:mannose-6-phosphate isomerase-like protein (cupin superfamily)